MQFETAPMSTDVKVITAAVLTGMVALLVASLYYQPLLLVAAIVGLISLFCYLYSPVSYDVSAGSLTILFRRGKRDCGRITRCTKVHKRVSMFLRVWGNGGLFAGTGLFWNKKLGFFRAYVTSSKTQYLILVHTDREQVLISPEHPEQLIEIAGFASD